MAIYQTYFNSGIYAKTSLKGGDQRRSGEDLENAISSLTRLIKEKEKDIEPSLRSECYLKLGQWHYEHKVNLSEEDFKVIMQNSERATTIDPKNQEGWHFYSLMNYEASIFYSKRLNEEFQHELGNVQSSSSIFDEFSAFHLQLLSANATTKQKILG